jgi:cation diffusion facilitator CzcD-associated flavoprotein CzcO
MTITPDVDVLIVGAGISGIGVGIALQRSGEQSFLLLEAAATLGGTWRDNSYPGVAVDIPSVSYCYPHDTDFPWSRVFAPGDEILRYVQHCVDKYALGPRIRYNTRVQTARFDQALDRWACSLSDGTVLTARHLVAATGLFGAPITPAIPGLDGFVGPVMHTAHWNHRCELRGARVAVIGTGASAVQVVPELAEITERLLVFQRTPIWVSPRVDLALAPPGRWSLRRLAAVRSLLRFASEAVLEFLTFAIVQYQRVPFLVGGIESVVRRWMRAQVADPETAERLLPQYRLGCKRPTASSRYLQVFDRASASLVTASITRIDATSIHTDDGEQYDVDAIILATGFRTTEPGNNPSFEVIGRGGTSLAQFWARRGREAYAGVTVPGFPNFFLAAGPFAGGFNWFTMLDAHIAHILGCLALLKARGRTRVEVRPDAHERYMRAIRRRARRSVINVPHCAAAHSYYLDGHGEASLTLPYTPWWRVLQRRRLLAEGYER